MMQLKYFRTSNSLIIAQNVIRLLLYNFFFLYFFGANLDFVRVSYYFDAVTFNFHATQQQKNPRRYNTEVQIKCETRVHDLTLHNEYYLYIEYRSIVTIQCLNKSFGFFFLLSSQTIFFLLSLTDKRIRCGAHYGTDAIFPHKVSLTL